MGQQVAQLTPWMPNPTDHFNKRLQLIQLDSALQNQAIAREKAIRDFASEQQFGGAIEAYHNNDEFGLQKFVSSMRPEDALKFQNYVSGEQARRKSVEETDYATRTHNQELLGSAYLALKGIDTPEKYAQYYDFASQNGTLPKGAPGRDAPMNQVVAFRNDILRPQQQLVRKIPNPSGAMTELIGSFGFNPADPNAYEDPRVIEAINKTRNIGLQKELAQINAIKSGAYNETRRTTSQIKLNEANIAKLRTEANNAKFPEIKDNAVLSADMTSKIVTPGLIPLSNVNIGKDVKEASGEYASQASFMAQLTALAMYTDAVGFEISSQSGNAKTAKALRTSLIGSYKEAKALGALDSGVIKFMDELLGDDPTGFSASLGTQKKSIGAVINEHATGMKFRFNKKYKMKIDTPEILSDVVTATTNSLRAQGIPEEDIQVNAIREYVMNNWGEY